MTNKEIAGVFLLVVLLAGCNDGGNSPNVSPLIVPAPTSGPPQPPPAGSAPESFHYLGLLWGAKAGPKHMYADSNCLTAERLAIAGTCIGRILLDGARAVGVTPRTGHLVEIGANLPGARNSAWIDIRRSVVGPVEDIDAEHLRMTVLGQRVHIAAQTQGRRNSLIGDSFDFADVALGDRVSVSGHFSADGNIIATLIERDLAPGPLVLRGILFADSDGLFRIGEQRVDLSAAALEDFPGGTPVEGDPVLLLADQEPQAGVLNVQTAQRTGSNWDPSQDESFEFNGFVTASHGPYGGFDISGNNFYYSTWDCLSCIRLADQSRQIAVGTFVTFSNAPTGSIDLNPGSPYWNATWLTGPVDSVDIMGAAFTVGGFEVQTNPATHLSAVGDPWVGSDTLQLAELAEGSTVTVRGGIRIVPGPARWQPDVRMVASSVVPGGEGIQVHTQLYRRADPEIIFLGRSILTDENTTLTGCDGNGACVEATPAWLFANTDYFQPVLTIEIDEGSVPLRAKHIHAERDP
ncbi:MAG: DUF5666 domain-containing protein [Gammaproteobacteria bacterium]|nr:DUF5666 domain-containing protein [Gammaproteobacteria bacterium]MDH5304392.1 DUF5666 domain-containing protein [Gammaproteobacteria bacterium]MDH5322105.1 DUF5666 domain-containing protein [Gammaproteobacteria bacterium]